MEKAESQSNIALGAFIQAFFTIISRVFGMVRDLMVSHFFGATLFTDAFYIAYTIPNVLRQFFGEGSFSVAFVPVYLSCEKDEGKDKARQFFANAFGFLLLIVCLTALFGIIFAKGFVYLFAFGYVKNKEQLDLTVNLTRYMFPYVSMISLVALFGAYLQCFRKFAAMAASPILLNLSMILSMLLFINLFSPSIYCLILGVILGGILQILLMILALNKNNIWSAPGFSFNTDAMKHFKKLLLPGLFGTLTYQLNIVILRQLASFLGEGQITYYYNADRLTQFAIGVFGVSLASASLPEISHALSLRGKEGLIKTLGFTLSITSFVITPCAIGLLFFSNPIISILFFHGAFYLDDVLITAKTLMAFAPSIIPFCLSRSLTQSFYILGNTAIPVKISIITLLINLFCGLFCLRFGVFGLAFTISISSTIQFICLWIAFKKLISLEEGLNVLKPFCFHLLLSFFSCLASFPLSKFASFNDGFTVFNFFILSLIIFSSATFYFLGAWFFKLEEAREVFLKIKERFFI